MRGCSIIEARREPGASTYRLASVFDPAKIDLVTIAPDRDAVLLYIVQSDGWSGSDEQLTALQQKIHAYVGFALDGQMERTYPETAGLPWRIVIESQAGAPDVRSAEMIERLVHPVRSYGGDLTTAGDGSGR
jgi:hypothetical protein